MVPGPIIIKTCCSCSQSIQEHTILSGNTFGATYWTDGKREAPMLPERRWLVKCPHCHTLLWIDEQRKLGEIDPCSNKYRCVSDSSQPCDVPSADDYFVKLEEGGLAIEKERYVRVHAWWACNDSRRRTQAKTSLSEREVRNLRALAKLLDESVANERIMKAEIMRELGLFDKSARLLDHPFDHELSNAVKIIRRLAEKRIPFVAQIRMDCAQSNAGRGSD